MITNRVIIDTNTRKIQSRAYDFLGVSGENDVEELVFELTDFVNGTAIAEIQKSYSDDKYYIALTKRDNTYVLPIKNSLLNDDSDVNMVLHITTANTEIFKSKIMTFKVYETINATEEIPEEYAEWIDIANAKLALMDESMEKVDELDQFIRGQETQRNQKVDNAISQINDMTQAYNTNATQKTSEFNSNASEKTSTFNTNANTKTNAFNTNVDTKTSEFNNNANQKKMSFDTNATLKTNEFNTNADTKKTEINKIKNQVQGIADDVNNTASQVSQTATTAITNINTTATNATTEIANKLTEFNTNATAKTETFNSNVTAKTTEFEESASTIVTNKTAEFEENASTITTTKTAEFNNNAKSKTESFNTNATEKTNEFNDNVNNMAVPVAGTTGQVLTKKSNTDRDVEWKDVSSKYFVITEDIVTVTTDATKGVAPYSTSYGYTNIEIDKNAGIEWVEGGLYNFVVDTNLVVNSSYRNVRVRIGGENDGDVWHPVMTSNSILSGSSYFIKSVNTTYQYKTVYRDEGALHIQTDNNTQYAYLVNTVVGDSTDSPVTIDDNGYGAKYSLIFPTTPLSDCIDGNERWSSPMLSSSNGTTKKAFTGKLYLDRTPLYLYSANVTKGAKPVNNLYQAFTGQELHRYLANTTENYITRRRRLYMYLKDFDSTDMSFYADATIGNTMTEDKIKTRFPSSTTGDVYLLYLGWTTSSWSAWQPDFVEMYKIYKYTPSTGKFVCLDSVGASDGDEVSY